MFLKNQNNFLNEGGAAGHMNHLYDNGDLTFSKIKEIFTKAASGELVGTEKTDGQNLMISFSVQDGRAKGVRNKSEIKNGGLTPEQLAEKFADRPNPALKETFAEALKIFEKAVQGLDHETQIELFGPDTSIYYNAEVMDPRTPNVIHYDTKSLVIHRAGHAQFDRATGKPVQADLTEKAAKLEEIILNAQEKIKDENYGLQVNAIKTLQALNDKEALKKAIGSLDRILSSTNYSGKKILDDNSTINEFMLARVRMLVDSILQKAVYEIGTVKPLARLNITKKILGVSDLKLPQIYKDLTPAEKQFVKDNIFNGETPSELLKMAISPLEDVVSEFASEMLKGLQSAFVIDNSKEVKRLRDEISSAIEAIKSSGNEEAMEILKRQMQKLKSAERITAAAEGFVFDYDGVTYKFTGNFAPANQILGLFKYGRGSVPPLKKMTEGRKKILEEESPVKRVIGVYGGRFQPMGKHHLEVFRQAQEQFGEENTYITTTDIVELPKSPLNFAEKKAIMVQQGVPEDKIIKVANPYKTDEIYQMVDPNITALSFIVGKKDMEPDEETGKPPRIKITDKNDYFKNKENGTLSPMSEGQGAYYVYVAPHVIGEVEVTKEDGETETIKFDSSTFLRKKIAEGDKNVFTGIMGFYNKKIYEFLVAKCKESVSYVKPEKTKKIAKNKKSVKENLYNDIINKLLVERVILKNNVIEEVVQEILQENIMKKGNKYCLISKKTSKNLGCYRSKKQAKKREKQVQYFKHIKEMSTAGGAAPAIQGVSSKPITKKEEETNG
jgi:hypothetical protein